MKNDLLTKALVKAVEKNIIIGKHMDESVPKLLQGFVNYRISEYPSARCEFCEYFNKTSFCQIVEGEISKGWVCDAYHGGWDVHCAYEVVDWASFGASLKEHQPLQLKIRDTVKTSCGWLVLMEDSMVPEPHRFSMNEYDFLDFTSRRPAWTMIMNDSPLFRGVVAGK